MLQENTDLNLGNRAFVLFALEKLKWVLVLIAVTIFLSIVRDAVQTKPMITLVSVLTDISILALLLGGIWARILYNNFTFSLEKFDMKMKSGVVQKREVSIPYRQIQSVDIVRSLAHQTLGLSKLVLLTAGHEEANEKHLTEVVLEPIDKKLAEELRDMLQERIGVQIVRPEAPSVALDAEVRR